jgi:hypothetical protein
VNRILEIVLQAGLWPDSEVEKEEKVEMRPRDSAIMEPAVLICQTGYVP